MAVKKTLEYVEDQRRIETWRSAESVIEDLQAVIDAGWIHTSVEIGDGYYEEHTLWVRGSRPATDKEKAKFLADQQKEREKKNADKIAKVEAEKAELARLLSKYGSVAGFVEATEAGARKDS